MDPEAPLDRPISTDRPLFLDDLAGADRQARPARVAALILGLLLAVLAAGLLTLSGSRSPSRPAAGSGVTASAAVRASEPSNAATAPTGLEHPDIPLPEPID